MQRKTQERQTPPAEILRAKDVMAMTGIRSQGHIENLIRQGDFPPKIAIGKRAVGWRAADVRNWIKTRPEVTPTTTTGGA